MPSLSARLAIVAHGPGQRGARVSVSARVLVAALGAAQIVSWGTVYYGFPLFVLPMSESLGWSLTLLNGAATAGLLVTGLCAYPVGACIDRYGGRHVMTLGSVGVAVLLASWSLVDSPVAFYAVWIALGACMAAVLYEPVFTVLTLHFGAGARRAITTLTLIAGFASTVFIPLIETLLAHLPWRDVLLLLALANLAICAPVHRLVLPRGHPDPTPADTSHAASGALLAVLRVRLADPVFRGLTVWFTAWAATASGLMFQLVPLLKAAGVDRGVMLAAVALIGPSQVAGRLVIMALGERAGLVVTGALTSTMFPVALLVLLFAPSDMQWLGAFAITFGIANGITTILRGAAPAEWLGREAYGRTMGAMGAPMMFAAALAPLATATLWTHTGSPAAVPCAVLAVSLVGAAGFWYAVAARQRSGGGTRAR